MKDISVEICTGSLSDVLTACQFKETDRIELNSALELGGLTPSLQTFLKSRKLTDKKIVCTVRPRTAGFRYNKQEKETMFADAQTFLEYGADGIAFGFLNYDLTVDEDTTGKMVSLIHGYGKEAVFHKAFDMTPDADKAVKTLIELGVDRILTSGKKPEIAEGMSCIQHLQKTYGDKIEILPAGGINEQTILPLLKETGCLQFHMSAREMHQDNGNYYAVSENQIRKVCNTIQSALFENRHTKTREDIDMMRKDAYESK